MTTRTRTRRRKGFTLLEMTVVMATLGVVMFLGVELIIAGLRAGGVVAAADTRAVARGELAREFRGDVARAESAPDRIGDLTAGPDCLILRMPDKSAVVYRWRDDGLVRVERIGDRETQRPLPLGPGRPRAEFLRANGGLVSLRLTETPKAGPDRVSDVSAALGGDLR